MDNGRNLIDMVCQAYESSAEPLQGGGGGNGSIGGGGGDENDKGGGGGPGGGGGGEEVEEDEQYSEESHNFSESCSQRAASVAWTAWLLTRDPHPPSRLTPPLARPLVPPPPLALGRHLPRAAAAQARPGGGCRHAARLRPALL